jgi:hypothetical protein
MAPVVPVLDIVRLLPLRLMAPLKVGAVIVPLLPIVSVPTALDPKLIGLDTVTEFPRRLAEPPSEAPRIIATVDGPAAPLTVVTLLTPAITVPNFMVSPPVKVLAPERVSAEVELFWMTPVTLVLMTALIVTPPEPVPELVMVPV